MGGGTQERALEQGAEAGQAVMMRKTMLEATQIVKGRAGKWSEQVPRESVRTAEQMEKRGMTRKNGGEVEELDFILMISRKLLWKTFLRRHIDQRKQGLRGEGSSGADSESV